MRTYLKFFLFFLIGTNAFSSQLPLEFSVLPQVAGMAAGQDQTLTYVIRNNLRTQALPLKSISIVNQGDSQASGVVTMRSTCGKTLAPSATCSITVTLQNVGVGKLARTLVIDYNGRALLTSSINMGVKQAAYTILVYIIGSNDLEAKGGYATKSIEQMMQVGSTSNMNVVIETGGAKPKPGWTTVKRQLVLPGRLVEIDDLGDINMGGFETIQSFIEWGVTHYPADKYIIAYWDHGGGPNGGFGDNANDVSIKDLKTATENAYAATGKKFEIIGFDACYLGNVETFAGLYPYSNYLLGSEDTEPGKSWQYNTFLNYVTHHPYEDGLAIGKVIIDGYTEQNEGSSTTLSIIASANMPDLLEKIKNFSIQMLSHISSSSNWLEIARSRYKAPDYGTSVWDNESYDLVDLAEFAHAIYINFTGAVKEAAEDLKITTNQAVKYLRNSSNREASKGLTIYFPSILPSYQTDYADKVEGLFPEEYINLVKGYYNFYANNTSQLQVSFDNFTFDGTDYSVEITGAAYYDELYAGVGSDECTSNGSPCIKALQNPDVDAPGVSGIKIFNKNENINSWPQINGAPVILIPNDTDPNTTDDGRTFLVPVEGGYLSVIKDCDTCEYEVAGFQSSAGSANTQSKITPISDGEEFLLRVLAWNGSAWQLQLSTDKITAPFTVSFGSLPGSGFDEFRFIASDLTGRLVVTNGSQPY